MRPADLQTVRQIAGRISRRKRPAKDDLEAAKTTAEVLIAFIDEVRRLRGS
jgi:hypothetical protein